MGFWDSIGWGGGIGAAASMMSGDPTGTMFGSVGGGLGGTYGAFSGGAGAGPQGAQWPGFLKNYGPGMDSDPNSPHPNEWQEMFMGPTPSHLTGTMGLKDYYGGGPGAQDKFVRPGEVPPGQSSFWEQVAQQGAQTDPNRMAGPEFRQAQLNLMQQYQDQAAGRGDSLAQLQLQKGTDANIAQQMSMAQSMRGAGGPAAQRQAMMNAANAQQGMAGDAAMLRLQEQMQARAALAGLAGQARGQDMGQMGMNDATRQFYAGLGSQRAVANQQAGLDWNKLRVDQNLRENEMRQKAFESSQARKGNFMSSVGGMIGKGMFGG